MFLVSGGNAEVLDVSTIPGLPASERPRLFSNGTFDFGLPTRAISGPHYQLCWAHDPGGLTDYLKYFDYLPNMGVRTRDVSRAGGEKSSYVKLWYCSHELASLRATSARARRSHMRATSHARTISRNVMCT